MLFFLCSMLAGHLRALCWTTAALDLIDTPLAGKRLCFKIDTFLLRFRQKENERVLNLMFSFKPKCWSWNECQCRSDFLTFTLNYLQWPTEPATNLQPGSTSLEHKHSIHYLSRHFAGVMPSFSCLSCCRSRVCVSDTLPPLWYSKSEGTALRWARPDISLPEYSHKGFFVS